MLSMALVEDGSVDGQGMEEVGVVQMDGPTDIDLIGVGGAILGEALVLVLGAPTTNVVGAASHLLLCPY